MSNHNCPEDGNYLYSCCPESIDGLTKEFVKELFKQDVSPIGLHTACLHCGRVYHIFKLGLKWTTQILSHSQLKTARELKEKYLTKIIEPIEHEVFKLSLADLSGIICNRCKRYTFADEPLELKEAFLDDLNMIFNLLIEMGHKVLIRENIVDEINKSNKSTCRKCYTTAHSASEKAIYN